MSPVLSVMRLGLRGKAHECAIEIARSHPDVMFTSGMRTKREQARAMSQNVFKSRSWVRDTYKPSNLVNAIERWLRLHPDKTTQHEIAKGILSVFDSMPDAEVRKFSRHLTGDAFDILPVTGNNGLLLKQSIVHAVALHGGKFLDREGGLIRWHAEF